MAMIPWWIHYPNVNNEIINLDWILQISNENTDKIENFIGVNTIKYADPILWDITSQYEANTIVVDPQTGDAYISTKAVPYGVALSNDGYWTRIYNYGSEIHVFREQIAADEQLSTTASAPRSVDDLVFLNGLLYIVTNPMIAGDSYVEGSNCAKTTINAQLLRLYTTITAEAQARADADTALGGRIDDEAQARADADTALGGRIDNEAQARADADTALGQRIDDANTALGQRIDNEAQARADANTALGQRIDNEALARADADTALGQRIDNITISKRDIIEVINVKEAGLDATGATDNSSRLTNIINDANEGATLYFPTGTYLFNSPIRLNKKINILGDGYTSILKFAADGIIINSDRCKLESFLMIPNSTLYTGIYCEGDFCRIDNVYLRDDVDGAYYWKTSIRLVDPWYTTVANCQINDYKESEHLNGVGIEFEGCVNLTLENNYIGFKQTGMKCTDVMVDNHYCDGIQIEGGNVVVCEYGIVILKGTNFFFNNLLFDQIVNHAMNFSGGQDFFISDAYISTQAIGNPSQPTIYIGTGVKNVTFTGCYIKSDERRTNIIYANMCDGLFVYNSNIYNGDVAIRFQTTDSGYKLGICNNVFTGVGTSAVTYDPCQYIVENNFT